VACLIATILLTPTLLPPEAEGGAEDQTSCVLELFEQWAVGEVGRGHNAGMQLMCHGALDHQR